MYEVVFGGLRIESVPELMMLTISTDLSGDRKTDMGEDVKENGISFPLAMYLYMKSFDYTITTTTTRGFVYPMTLWGAAPMAI